MSADPSPVTDDEETEECTFFHLPEEVQLLILSYLTPRDLCISVAPVCHYWHYLANQGQLWRRLQVPSDKEMRTSTAVFYVQHAPHLRCLCLEHRKDCAVILLEAAQHCPEISDLSLCSCHIPSQVLAVVVQQMSTLKRLVFRDNYPFGLRELRLLTSLTSLEHIVFEMYFVSIPKAPIVLSFALRCDRLVSAYFLIQEVTDEEVQYLIRSGKQKLREVVVNSSNCAAGTIESLSGCPNLELLGLFELREPALKGLCAVQRFPALRRLRLWNFDSDKSCRAQVHFCNLFSCRWMKDLTQITLSEMDDLDDHCLEILASHCQNLTSLTLEDCMLVTDAGISYVIQQCLKLKELVLDDLRGLRGTSLRLIPNHLPNLARLNICYCSGITAEFVRELRTLLPRVQIKVSSDDLSLDQKASKSINNMCNDT